MPPNSVTLPQLTCSATTQGNRRDHCSGGSTQLVPPLCGGGRTGRTAAPPFAIRSTQPTSTGCTVGSNNSAPNHGTGTPAQGRLSLFLETLLFFFSVILLTQSDSASVLVHLNFGQKEKPKDKFAKTKEKKKKEHKPDCGHPKTCPSFNASARRLGRLN